MVRALYLLLEGLESKDQLEHQEFMSIIMRYEEEIHDDTTVSYYETIRKLSEFKYRQSLDTNRFSKNEDERRLEDMSQEFGTTYIESMYFTQGIEVNDEE
jgi:hypothetical protein